MKTCKLCLKLVSMETTDKNRDGPIAKKPSIEVLYLCAKFQCSDSKSSENSQNQHIFPPFCVGYSTVHKYKTHYDRLQQNMPPDSKIRAL